jgi:hypothetical protein
MRRTILALALGALSACGGGMGSTSSAAHVPLGPTWAGVWQNILGPKCSGCHSGTGLGMTMGGLDMSTEAAAAAYLVGVASPVTNTAVTVSPRPLRVAAGSSAASLLYIKVSGTPPAGYGSEMPYLLAPLSALEVAAIQGWIDGGASVPANPYYP